MRTALDVGAPHEAIAALNDELEVSSSSDLPKKLEGDNALLLLDRGSIQQSVTHFDLSKRDLEASDKAIDMLDLAHNAGDTIGEYVFSGSSGRYRAPPYEKLLINTLNMVNYLETRDLNGARVEARRLAVVEKYFRDDLGEGDNPTLGLGSLLAGFAFEKSGEADEALRFYDEALPLVGPEPLMRSVRRLAAQSSYRSPRLRALLDEPAAPDDDAGDVLLILGYGRVPHKVAERIPIGLALTYFSSALSPADRAGANRLAAQGLVTWINFPTLAPGRGTYEVPACAVDGAPVALREAVDLEREVRTQWKKIEGKIVVSAITRMVARFAVGEGIQTATGRGSIVGLLASIGSQATLAALDTPDTRSWEALPSRIAVARVRLRPGRHRIALDSRGWHRHEDLVIEPHGWAVVSLMGLR